MVIKFCTCNPTSNFDIYLWNIVLLFGKPLNNHRTKLLKPCKVVNILHKCHNIVAILLGRARASPTLMWKLVRWSMHEEPQRKAGLQHTTVVLVCTVVHVQTKINLRILPYKCFTDTSI